MIIGVDVDNVIKSLELLNSLKDSETTYFSKIINSFNQLNSCCIGPFDKEVNAVNNNIYNNFKVVGINHETDINFISSNITNYKKTIAYTEKIFEKLGE